MKDGTTYDSGVARALWDLSAQATDEELREKFRRLACPNLPGTSAGTLEDMIWHCADLDDVQALPDLLTCA